MADPTIDARLGQVVAGYRIEERIGRGGMGLVYRAQHLALDRRAALKLIAPELAETPGFRERFNREVRIAARLQHPNVVTVYDAGDDGGLLYLAMRYIGGADLAAMLHAQGRLGAVQAVDVCRQVAAALDAAHAEGLIHRDVKPANVLVEGGTAFLTDFGVTKRVEGTPAHLTRVGDVVGTIHYVAPEQITGGRVDARADVYSLGCLLYHCVVGELPFSRDTDVAVMYAHLCDTAPAPSALCPGLPAELDAVIAKALEKEPERRFRTCGDLTSAAAQVLDAAGALAEPARARRVPPLGDRDDVLTTIGPGLVATARHPDPPVAEGRPAVAGAAAARRPRVLLAGVEATARAVTRVALAGSADVREAPPGERLLDTVRDHRPDLVILDWSASVRPVHEEVAALRADAVARDARVLLLVEHDAAGADTASAGADERLAAPFSSLQLQVKLRRMLGAAAVAG